MGNKRPFTTLTTITLKKQAGALRNIQNHINAVGAENLDLKVVLHGNGLALLIYPRLSEQAEQI